jgi:predicted nuclease with TOPRIM domain
LGGLAESLGAGAVDIAESLEADKARIREMQRERAQLANLRRKEKMEVMQMCVDLTGRVAALNEGIENRKAEVAAKKEELKLRRDELNMRIEAAKNQGLDVDQMVFQMFLKGGPLKEAATEYLTARYGSKDGDKSTLEERLTGKPKNEKQNPASLWQ